MFYSVILPEHSGEIAHNLSRSAIGGSRGLSHIRLSFFQTQTILQSDAQNIQKYVLNTLKHAWTIHIPKSQ